MTEKELDAACDAEIRAREKEKFFERQLERLDFTPRMDEKEYFAAVDIVKNAVEKAAADFRKVAEKAIEDIIEAKKRYESTISEADAVLTDLDDAANVLQVKYRYKEYTYKGGVPSSFAESKSEWRQHAVRYGGVSSKGSDLAIKDGNEWNRKLSAAWLAADRAQYDPERNFQSY